MKTKEVRIDQQNRIYLNEEIMQHAGFKAGDILVFRCNGSKNGLVLHKPGLLDKIEVSLGQLDEDFEDLYSYWKRFKK